MNEHNGNPNKTNNNNETALHAVCSLSPQSSYSAHERRAACVTLLLNWQGNKLFDGRREKIKLCAQDIVSSPLWLSFFKNINYLYLLGWKYCSSFSCFLGLT